MVAPVVVRLGSVAFALVAMGYSLAQQPQPGEAIAAPGTTIQQRGATLSQGNAFQPIFLFNKLPRLGAPLTGLIADSSGALYEAARGYGTRFGGVFKLSPAGTHFTETTLYAFHGGVGGQEPYGPLVRDGAGDLFGTAYSGGSFGAGLVFELTPTAKGYAETTLYNFQDGTDAQNPAAGLVEDANGVLYGTATLGGAYGQGAVFRLTPSGSGYTESIVHDFAGAPTDGADPVAPLAIDAAGDLFGTTSIGGVGCASPGCGTVFELAPSGATYTESLLHNFGDATTIDGAQPQAGLLIDAAGDLYGTTLRGGFRDNGTVFELRLSGGNYVEQILYRFRGNPDGARPASPLVLDSTGSFYGTTAYGGQYSNCDTHAGCGAIFKLTPTGSTYGETVLHSFGYDDADGYAPYAGVLIPPGSTSLYGAAASGGDESCDEGCGSIFSLKI